MWRKDDSIEGDTELIYNKMMTFEMVQDILLSKKDVNKLCNCIKHSWTVSVCGSQLAQ